MALNTLGIATAITALDLSGVDIRDIDGIPVSVTGRSCPIMYPSPDGLVGGYSGKPMTFTVATAYWEITRTLRYIYLHAPLGADRALSFDYHKAMAENADSLIELMAEMDITGVDVVGVGIGAFGPIPDPSGNTFHGFNVSIVVREQLNA